MLLCCIVIIDGNFSWVPSVWHKEILTAIDYGLEVFGAASMGALRAAELDAFGMKGYGRIYEMYKNEQIDGDDEVAIAYSQYNNEQTIPFINIRLTLEKIDINNKETILNSIRSIFYADRTWDRLAKEISKEDYCLIKSNYMDVKKEDSKSLLRYLSQQTNSLSFNSGNTGREFTLFEKKLIESTFSPVLLNVDAEEKKSEVGQRNRAKNIIQLMSIPKTKKNLLRYQSIISILDNQPYNITEYELIYQVELFREELNLLTQEAFVNWLKDRKLYNINVEQLFYDYVKLNKYLAVSYDYNNYFN